MRSAKLEIQTVRSRTVMAMVGARNGRVIDRKRWNQAGAVDRGRLVEIARDRLQRREQRDGEERNAPPDIGDDRPPHRVVRIGEDVAGLAHQAERKEPVRQRADDRIEQPGPVEAGEEARHRPGQEHQRLHDAPAPERLVEQQRQDQAEDELQDDGGPGPPAACSSARRRRPRRCDSARKCSSPMKPPENGLSSWISRNA